MSKRKGDKKVDTVKVSSPKEATKTTGVEKTQQVDTVGAVAALGGALGVRGVKGSSGKGARSLSFAERAELFAMIDEEVEKVIGPSGFSARHKELVRNAVRMAVDSGLVDDSSANTSPDKPKK